MWWTMTITITVTVTISHCHYHYHYHCHYHVPTTIRDMSPAGNTDTVAIINTVPTSLMWLIATAKFVDGVTVRFTGKFSAQWTVKDVAQCGQGLEKKYHEHPPPPPQSKNFSSNHIWTQNLKNVDAMKDRKISRPMRRIEPRQPWSCSPQPRRSL
jgi:hypothetical protein